MKRFLAALLLVCAPGLLSGVAHAQAPPGAADVPYGQYNAIPPTLTDKNYAPMQLDSAGNAKVTGTVTVDTSALATQATLAAVLAKMTADPCQTVAKASVAISQTANTKLFSQTSAKKNYICSIMMVGADAENVSLVEGTGSTCGTSTAAIIGGTTAATGPNLAANGGFSLGNGIAAVAAGANNNFDVCLLQSGSGRVAGVLTYVQQ